jgi:hypothetical protein
MYNATISFRNFGGRVSEHRLAPTNEEDVIANEQLFRQLLERSRLDESELVVDDARVRALVGLAPADSIFSLLERYRWYERRKLLVPELEFLSGRKGDPEIEDWALIVPQLHSSEAHWEVAGQRLSVHLRRRASSTNLVNAYSGPEDRRVAAAIVGTAGSDNTIGALARLRREHRGVLLVYPITHSEKVNKEWVPTMGFTIVFPPNHIKRQVSFVVKNPEQPDEPIVTARPLS